MAPLKTIGCALVLASLLLGVASPSGANDDAFKIIVHPDNPVTAVDADFLRLTFLKKSIHWGDDTAISPVDLAKGVRARDRFTKDVLKKTPAQLRSYWAQRIFSGTAVPPPEVDSPEAAVAYVLANRGAVAYVPVDTDPGRAKVIPLR